MSISATITQQIIKEAEEAFKTDEYHLAAKKYDLASEAFAAQGDTGMAAEMANNRSVSLLKAGDFNAAYQAALNTDQVFLSIGDVRRQAIALSNQASALENLKKVDQAIELYQKSAALLKEINEREMRAYVLKSISYLQFRHRKPFDAMATMKAALDSQTRLSLRERLLKTLLGIVFRLLGG
jgi:tetratricopeptide (TPR) repeat protein